MRALQKLDAESRSTQNTILDTVRKIDGKPPLDLDPLHSLVTKIDGNLPADLQPVLDAVNGIDVKPVVKVDVRQVIDAMNAGLARIEVASRNVDLGDVTSMLKKIDNRLLEA